MTRIVRRKILRSEKERVDSEKSGSDQKVNAGMPPRASTGTMTVVSMTVEQLKVNLWMKGEVSDSTTSSSQSAGV